MRATAQALLCCGLLAMASAPVETRAEEEGLSTPAEASDETRVDVERKSGTVLEMQPDPEPSTEPRQHVSMPEHGMKMAEVQRRYGAPRTRHPAVGQPPITRWDYDRFSVFFEYSTVLHSVEPEHPAPIHHQDELLPSGSPMAGESSAP
jgi:hypothetical protein